MVSRSRARRATSIAAVLALAGACSISCSVTPDADPPASGDANGGSQPERAIGGLRPPPVPTPGPLPNAPPPSNNTPPSLMTLVGIHNNPDGTFTTLPNVIESSNTVGVQWINNDGAATASNTVYRQVTDASGNCSPSCTSYTAVATFPGLAAGPMTWIDTAAVPNAHNCYYIADTNSAGVVGATTLQCVYTRDGNDARPTRVQLSLTVGPTYDNMTVDPVHVTLQDTDLPTGNVSWLAKDTPYLNYGGTSTFDLYLGDTVKDLSDITRINVGVAGSDDLCVSSMTLLVDWNGDPTDGYRVAYYKDFSALPGGCTTLVNSDTGGPQINVGFQELRQSPDWNAQVQSFLDAKTGGVPHFHGYFDGTATRGMLMGLLQNQLHAKGIQMRVDHPIELTVLGNDVRGDDILRVKAHVNKDCDAYAQIDIRIVNDCGCAYGTNGAPNGANAITSSHFVLENTIADLEPWSLCWVGDQVLGGLTEMLTLGQWSFTDWLYQQLNGPVASALANVNSPSLAPPKGIEPAFSGAPSTYGGLGVAPGQVCDYSDPDCSCATITNTGYCEPD